MLQIDCRDFICSAAALSTTLLRAVPGFVAAAFKPPTRMRVGVIGCGNVSASYLPHFTASPHVELVSACDIIPARAEALAKAFNIPHFYPQIDTMLAGAEFDLLVNLTNMQEHERLNRAALASGKHVWSEKPLANSFEAGQSLLALAEKHGLRIWRAPAMVASPAFAFMAESLASGKVGEIQVVADDNAMLLMDHGDGVISHVQSGFNYFNPHDHRAGEETRETISIIGSEGTMGLVGYDWDPRAVDLATLEAPSNHRRAIQPNGFCWQMGASPAAESLFTGRPLLITPEHAVHLLEVIETARQSQEGGRRIELQSRFQYPIGA